MNRALLREQRADIAGHVQQAISEVRAVIEAAPDVGPVLVAPYRALSALGSLREMIDAMPLMESRA